MPALTSWENNGSFFSFDEQTVRVITPFNTQLNQWCLTAPNKQDEEVGEVKKKKYPVLSFRSSLLSYCSNWSILFDQKQNILSTDYFSVKKIQIKTQTVHFKIQMFSWKPIQCFRFFQIFCHVFPFPKCLKIKILFPWNHIFLKFPGFVWSQV